jgi:hypothetical protein
LSICVAPVALVAFSVGGPAVAQGRTVRVVFTILIPDAR